MATVAAARTTDGHILESPAASRRARKATKEPDPMSTTAREQLSLATPQKVADLQWRPVDPNNPSGARMAALWGDPLSGPYGALLRMPAGFESPMHRHSSHERVVVIDGASLHWAEGHDRRAARIMRSGDYLLIPAGVNHVSAATAGEECLELITQDGEVRLHARDAAEQIGHHEDHQLRRNTQPRAAPGRRGLGRIAR
jgi:anti-sigma factor ChrR (cupin superfamily)